ncbi:DUF429 domain-containing protein [Microvirga sp. VF16]|uniref:DUF429 domain-containing protein n=1 Tax=Microvirga sp. VF16 TaxID=2807101 RepID=UPI00193E80D2|nr:DUF429 domain-containing protein [Microvirga sp. VF16]QRM36055.1 DUF429 domain-containing protein [Microvirga sp. VF16]
MFDHLIHADWSVDPRKRWQASAIRDNGLWKVSAPCPVGAIPTFLDGIFSNAHGGRTLVGFDFPIGIPSAYGSKTGLVDFRDGLRNFGEGDWAQFFDVVDQPDDVSIRRPFYPKGSLKGVSRSSLVAGLGMESFDSLLRTCERRTSDRQAACSLFWTLGGNQAGRAAISGWREVVRAALERGAALWPFDGSLAELSARSDVVLAETYPAEAYRMFNAAFRSGESKRRRSDRASKAPAILDWAAAYSVHLSDAAETAVRDGFGEAASGEDAFDALAGLLKMIEVADGRRPEATVGSEPALTWEGWILGR